MTKLDARGFSLTLDDRGSITAFSLEGRVFQPPLGYTLVELDKEIADLAPAGVAGRFAARRPGASGTLAFTAAADIRLRFTPDEAGSRPTIGLVVPFPESAELHIPRDYNIAHRITSDMPCGHELAVSLGYNFFLAQAGGIWIRFMARQEGTVQRLKVASVSVWRHPGLFLVTFGWRATDEAAIAVFPTMQAAIADYQAWLEGDLGITPRSRRSGAAQWVDEVPLVLVVDMMRSDGEISHDYADVRRLAGDLAKARCPRDTMLYLPGWNGEYDGLYPTYLPHRELGGETGFRAMVDALHANGYRVMLHTNPWGVDPAHPDLDAYRKVLLLDRDGDYAGFQTASYTKWGHIAPNRRTMKFRTARIPVVGATSGASVSFDTVHVPDKCEALLSFGGWQPGDLRLKVTIGRRTISSPAGALREAGEYSFPFTFLLRPGTNRVSAELAGGAARATSLWYRIERCYIPPDPYETWSHPILFADTANPEWVSIFVGNVASVVRQYGIDAIHCDATDFESNTLLYAELARALPDVPKAGEGMEALAPLGYWSFVQMGGGQSMIGYLDVMRGTRQQCSIPDTGRLEELYSWLDHESPACAFVKDYVRLYPHLCAADAFVPTGKVCNTSPKMQSPRSRESLWKVIRDVRRLDYLPGLRLNYRDHGLDSDTRKAIRELTGKG